MAAHPGADAVRVRVRRGEAFSHAISLDSWWALQRLGVDDTRVTLSSLRSDNAALAAHVFASLSVSVGLAAEALVSANGTQSACDALVQNTLLWFDGATHSLVGRTPAGSDCNESLAYFLHAQLLDSEAEPASVPVFITLLPPTSFRFVTASEPSCVAAPCDCEHDVRAWQSLPSSTGPPCRTRLLRCVDAQGRPSAASNCDTNLNTLGSPFAAVEATECDAAVCAPELGSPLAFVAGPWSACSRACVSESDLWNRTVPEAHRTVECRNGSGSSAVNAPLEACVRAGLPVPDSVRPCHLQLCDTPRWATEEDRAATDQLATLVAAWDEDLFGVHARDRCAAGAGRVRDALGRCCDSVGPNGLCCLGTAEVDECLVRSFCRVAARSGAGENDAE